VIRVDILQTALEQATQLLGSSSSEEKTLVWTIRIKEGREADTWKKLENFFLHTVSLIRKTSKITTA
jgi:hypothetical protein